MTSLARDIHGQPASPTRAVSDLSTRSSSVQRERPKQHSIAHFSRSQTDLSNLDNGREKTPPRSIEIETNSLYTETVYRAQLKGRSLLCVPGHDTWKPTKFVMFQVSGGIGMILFYIAWSDIFYRLKGVKHGPMLSWSLAYALSVLWQHLLNRTLVFTDLQQSYWESLGGMCVVYMFSLVLSSVLNVLFVEVLSIAANFAFFVTAVFTGAVNYVIIAKCALGGEGTGEEDKAEREELRREWDEDRDPAVDLARHVVAGIQLPNLELQPTLQLPQMWGKKIQQTAKHWAGDHQV